jgi:hypothetical protein
MLRKVLLSGVACTVLLAVVAFSQPKPGELTVLEWAKKGKAEEVPVALLIEMGVKDTMPADWNGKASVTGARVVHREGYRFRDGDKLVDPDGWEAKSRRPIRVPKGQPAVAKMEGIASVGVVVHLADVKPDAAITVEAGEGKAKVSVPLADVLAGKPKPLWDGDAVVRRITTTSALTGGRLEDDFPAAAYGPDGTLWVAYISYHIKDEDRRIEQKGYKEQPANFKTLSTPEFGDQIVARYYRDGKWSEPIAITDAAQDLVRCAVAVAGDGEAWVIYSAHRGGKFNLFARPVSKKYNPAAVENPPPKPGPEQQITKGSGPNLTPVACTTSDGAVRVACQSWGTQRDRDPGFFIEHFALKEGKFVQAGMQFGRDGMNHWSPALAAGPGDMHALAWDAYDGSSDYDVIVLPSGTSTVINVAATSKFEARPSLCYDASGRLWIAYEEGPEKWGKNYGALDSQDGQPLYSTRNVRVVCLDGGKLMKPTAELPESSVKPPQIPLGNMVGPNYERALRYSSPVLGLDGKGRLWLTYRVKYGSRYSSHAGSYWFSWARRLDGDHWSEPIEIHHSDGLLDYRPVLLPHPSGGLRIIHNGDGRFTVPETVHNHIFSSVIDLPGEPAEPKLVPHDAGKKDPELAKRFADERAAIKRIQDYRIESGGTKYQLLRGEFHRHTEISWDGGPDGSLEDMWRYAIDVAGMDWIGNGDHDNGAGREYSWWLTQKTTDAYHVSGRFTPMFTYERSVAYPHGHRNCMFAQRGVRTLPRLNEPEMEKRVGGVHADDTKMLYRYLKEMNGICAVHTSATSMGTDWRDNDPEVEPFVEIYQGDRMNYEHEAAPRAGYDPKTGKEPANIAGWFPDGFIDHAFQKGYKLGFQSSSDHWSTHISYCIALAEKHDRASILAAFKKRHCYGATDDIILDVRSGTHLMGDSFKSDAPPKLDIHAIGTGDIERIDVLRDSKVVDIIKPPGREYKSAWSEPKPPAGVHWYYVRVVQKNGELAWSSPLWIDSTK